MKMFVKLLEELRWVHLFKTRQLQRHNKITTATKQTKINPPLLPHYAMNVQTGHKGLTPMQSPLKALFKAIFPAISCIK